MVVSRIAGSEILQVTREVGWFCGYVYNDCYAAAQFLISIQGFWGRVIVILIIGVFVVVIIMTEGTRVAYVGKRGGMAGEHACDGQWGVGMTGGFDLNIE